MAIGKPSHAGGRIAIVLLAVSLFGYQFIDEKEGDGPTTVTTSGEIVAQAYADPAHGWKKPTICKGHTKGVFKGQQVSLDQCEEWLAEDISDALAEVQRCIRVAVTSGQLDMLVSFTENTGMICKTVLAAKTNAGDCLGAAREFNDSPQLMPNGKPRIWMGRSIIDKQTGKVLLATGDTVKKWTTASGIPLAGLIKRRAEERAVFEEGCKAW